MEETQNFEGNKDNIGEQGHFERTEEQANLFQRNNETGTYPLPPPRLRGLRISPRRQSTTNVMAYNFTQNSPLLYKQ